MKSTCSIPCRYKAGRLVTRSKGYTSTRKLMTACRWLSVKQLVFYQSAAMVHKILLTICTTGLTWSNSYRTRQQTRGCIRFDETFRFNEDLPKKNFRCRGATNVKVLRKWIKTNINLQ